MESGKILTELIELIQEGVPSEKIYSLVVEEVQKRIAFTSATFYVYSENKNSLVLEYQVGPDKVDLITEFDFGSGSGLSGWVVKQKHPVIVSSLPNIQIQRKTQFKSFVAWPLWMGKRLIGVLNLGHTEKAKYLKEDMQTFKVLSEEISFIFEHLLLRNNNSNLEENIKNLKTEVSAKETELKKIKDSAAIGEIVLKFKNEIKKPLLTIKGLAEILELSIHTLPPKRVKETLHALVTESRRMENILNQVEDNSDQT